jgi:hypothetical protein
LSNSFRGSEISKPIKDTNEKYNINGIDEEVKDCEVGFDELPDFSDLPSQNTSRLMSQIQSLSDLHASIDMPKSISDPDQNNL